MGFFELAMIGVGLSMDAFAVAVSKGLGMEKTDFRYMVVLAAFFGGFQALMPFVGWLLGSRFQAYIAAIDHWIAFGLLTFLGVRMIIDAVRAGREETKAGRDGAATIDLREFFLLAVATSIDALAVGITFAFLQVGIYSAVALIGCITFGFSVAGVLIGKAFGGYFQNKAAVVGGAILIFIGVKILMEHLGIL